MENGKSEGLGNETDMFYFRADEENSCAAPNSNHTSLIKFRTSPLTSRRAQGLIGHDDSDHNIFHLYSAHMDPGCGWHYTHTLCNAQHKTHTHNQLKHWRSEASQFFARCLSNTTRVCYGTAIGMSSS